MAIGTLKKKKADEVHMKFWGHRVAADTGWSEKLTFEQKFEEIKGAGRKETVQIPEAGVSLVYVGNVRETSMAGA